MILIFQFFNPEGLPSLSFFFVAYCETLCKTVSPFRVLMSLKHENKIVSYGGEKNEKRFCGSLTS